MTTGFLEREVGDRRFVVYVPQGVPGPFPAILFLHGSGECGVDNLRPLSVGLPRAIMRDRSRWPFLVVIPQKPDSSLRWFEVKDYLDACLGSVEEEFEIDGARRTITGLSQGGCGTFELAAHLSWNFAAAAPVCGFTARQDLGPDFRDIPVWAFHGDADSVVPVSRTQEAVAQILAAGGQADLTIYPGVDHNSWDEAYEKSGLAEWLLNKRR